MNIPELLFNLSIHYNALIRKSASELGLTASQAFHLISIPYDGISMSSLSKKLGLDTSTLTRNIARLESMNLVQKNQNDYDRRIQTITITKNGSDMVDKIDEFLNEINHYLVENLDMDTQEYSLEILEKLVWSMDCLRENQ